MPKRTGNPNGPKTPWKAARQALRRAEAEKRNAKFQALPASEKRKINPKKEYRD